MAGSCSKANQMQSAKRKNRKGPKYGIACSRMHTIPLTCKACGKTRVVPSQDAYKPGGTICCITEYPNGNHVPNRFSFETSARDFGPTRIKLGK